MKRKKIPPQAQAPAEAAPTVRPDQAAPSQTALSRNDRIWVVIWGLLLFTAVTVQTGRMALILAALAVVSLVVKKGRKPLMLCIPVLGLLLFALMEGLSAIYSPFDETATREYYKILAALAVTVILLTRYEKKHVPGLLWAFSSVSAVLSLLCVDMDSGMLVFRPFNALMNLCDMDYSKMAQTGSSFRINGLYNDANISSAIFALAALICLYLLRSGKREREKIAASVLLAVNSIGILLSLSRGVIAFFGLSLIVWLVLAGKGERLELFLLMAFSASAAAVGTLVAAKGVDGRNSLLVLLGMAVAGALTYGFNRLLTVRLAGVLDRHRKLSMGAVALLVVLCIGYIGAALTVTRSYTIGVDGYTVCRLRIEPGEHTLTLDADEGVEIEVAVQNIEEALQGTLRTLYREPYTGQEVRFTVPDEPTLIINVYMLGETGLTVRSMILDGSEEVPLYYPLLPNSIALRLQDGLFDSISGMARGQYVKDTLKIFATSPIIGRGLSSTENLYTSVQPYYYESLFAHSHILQVMADTGLVGLTGFLALQLGALWFLIRKLRGEKDPLTVLLLVCWVMLNGHGAMEFDFSIRAFQCFGYGLLALMIIWAGEPMLAGDSAKQRKLAKGLGAGVMAAFALYFAAFGTMLELHRSVDRQAAEFETTSLDEFLVTLKKYITMDRFIRSDNMVTYVANAVQADSPYYRADMKKYVAYLEDSGTYHNLSALSEYYYMPRGEWEDAFRASRESLIQMASHPEAWNLEFDFYRERLLPEMGAENVELFLNGVQAASDQLDEHNTKMMFPTRLNAVNESFRQLVRDLRAQGVSGEEAYQQLLAMSTAEE